MINLLNLSTLYWVAENLPQTRWLLNTFIPWSDQPTADTMSTAAESKPKEDIRDELVFILSLSNETDDVVRYLWKVMLLYSFRLWLQWNFCKTAKLWEAPLKLKSPSWWTKGWHQRRLRLPSADWVLWPWCLPHHKASTRLLRCFSPNQVSARRSETS